jgi:hypothetical protein
LNIKKTRHGLARHGLAGRGKARLKTTRRRKQKMALQETAQAMVEIEGVSPILHHSAQLADPTNEWTLEMKKITSKHHSKKTDADMERLVELEFQGGLYFDDEIGPIIPDYVIEGAIRDAARTTRKGKQVESGIMVTPEKIKLIYDGPRDRNSLFSDKRFVDTRAVKLQKKNTIMRTRPRFDKWSAAFEVTVICEVIDIESVAGFLETAGKLKGVMDYRPKFGRFVVKTFEIV